MAITNLIGRLRDSVRGVQKPYPNAPDKLWWGGTQPEDYDPDFSDLEDPSLKDLANAFGSDKGELGSGHGYTDVYEQLVSDLMDRRGSDALSICEIGVACGASLKMWSHYLPQAKVLGIDIREECSHLCQKWDNINIEIGDPRHLEFAPNGFDLIVDAASHLSEDIRENFNHCFSWLRPGGYYVVEDTHCVGDKEYVQSLMDRFGRTKLVNDRSTFVEMVDEIMLAIDSRGGTIGNISYFPSMLVVEKRAETK